MAGSVFGHSGNQLGLESVDNAHALSPQRCETDSIILTLKYSENAQPHHAVAHLSYSQQKNAFFRLEKVGIFLQNLPILEVGAMHSTRPVHHAEKRGK